MNEYILFITRFIVWSPNFNDESPPNIEIGKIVYHPLIQPKNHLCTL
jgi:hypothetical protein